MDQEEISKKVQRMTRAEQMKRLDELNTALGVTSPHSTGTGSVPPAQNIEELFEREYLKKALGYSS
jgi:hypothetical protein